METEKLRCLEGYMDNAFIYVLFRLRWSILALSTDFN
jgi:hypothetical protein